MTILPGKRCIVVRRHACHDRLANAMYHWARIAAQHDPRSKTGHILCVMLYAVAAIIAILRIRDQESRFERLMRFALRSRQAR
jgi:hypothetical protein